MKISSTHIDVIADTTIVLSQDPRHRLRIEEAHISQGCLSKARVDKIAQRCPEPCTQRDRKSLLAASENFPRKNPGEGADQNMLLFPHLELIAGWNHSDKLYDRGTERGLPEKATC